MFTVRKERPPEALIQTTVPIWTAKPVSQIVRNWSTGKNKTNVDFYFWGH